MDDIVRNFQARVGDEPFGAPFHAHPKSVVHAAAIALYHFHKRQLSLDDVIHVRSSQGLESGSATIRQVLEWVKSDQGRVAFHEEPIGFRDVLLDYAERLGL